MGYARYTLPDGREAGYAIETVCEAPDCAKPIDRGLAYLCGEDPIGDEYGCTHYFCEAHLFMGGPSQLCEPCYDAWAAGAPDTRCFSCDHEMAMHHRPEGCRYAVTVGAVGANLVCPCEVMPAEAPDGERA